MADVRQTSLSPQWWHISLLTAAYKAMFFIQTGDIRPSQSTRSCRASLRLQPPVLVPTRCLKSSFPAGLSSKEMQLGTEPI